MELLLERALVFKEEIDVEGIMDVKVACTRLRPKHQYVIKKLIEEGMTQQVLADHLGISQSYLCRIYKEALKQLKKGVILWQSIKV